MATCNCCGQVLTVICPEDCPEVVAYTFQNDNLAGIGVWETLQGTVVSFRGIESGNALMTAVHNAANRTVLLTIDINAIAAAFPAATESVSGILEVATQAETNAGALDTKIITPLKLFTMAATEAQRGVLELATQAEVTTGTNDTTAVTPLKLATNLATQKLTRTFADAVARAAAVPAFKGQFGYQLDTQQPYTAGSVVAGDWQQVFGEVTTLSGVAAVIDATAGSSITFQSTGATGSIDFINLTIGISSSIYNWAAGNTFRLSGVAMPANSLLRTTAAAGTLSSITIASFVSNQNTQAGYTAFTNPATIRTLDTSTATLQQVAQCLGTLIEDLKAVRLPAT